jgi:Protein of unknown function (DUF3987)/Bifunctional DNA primase/polymerase, N-terminal/Primase C terminal 1 (PriCT-1)
LGAGSKRCSRTGSGAWKNARPLSAHAATADAAAAYFRTRARRANPIIVAGVSGAVLLDYDGPEEELNARYGLPRLPETLSARSARGRHAYLAPPAGRGPMKIEIKPDKIMISADGYLVTPPALHASGHVYAFLDGRRERAELPLEFCLQVEALAELTREQEARHVELGGEIPEGGRDEALFSVALGLIRDGYRPEQVLERILRVNAEQCRPPLPERTVHDKLKAATVYARRHPTAQEQARETARRLLEGGARREPVEPKKAEAPVWEVPVPLAFELPVPEFPVDVLPDWMARFVRVLAAGKGAALDLVASLCLGVVAGAIARNVIVSPRGGFDEPTTVYVIVALRPGQRKTPVFVTVLRPVWKLEQGRIEDWEAQTAPLGLNRDVLEERRRRLVRELARDDDDDDDEPEPPPVPEGDDPLAQLAAALREAELPPEPRLVTEDVTPEALAHLLAEHGRIIAASDEGAALFENLAGRYAGGSTSWDVLNKGHSGGYLVVDRRSRGSQGVFDPALTLAVATQPGVLRDIAQKPGAAYRGVLARPLYSLPRPVFADITPEAASAALLEYETRVTRLYEDTPELVLDADRQPQPLRLTLDPAARALFEAFERETNAERRQLAEAGDELEGDVYLDWISKLAGQTARLAALLHVAEHWTHGSSARHAIGADTVRSAVELGNYYREHARAAFGLMEELPERRSARTILRWLATRTEGELATLTVRDVHRSRGKGTEAADVRKALRVLEEHGYLRVSQSRVHGGRRGPAPEAVLLHPAFSNPPNRPDKPDEFRGLGADSAKPVGFVGSNPGVEFCAEHPGVAPWRARDGLEVLQVRPSEPPGRGRRARRRAAVKWDSFAAKQAHVLERYPAALPATAGLKRCPLHGTVIGSYTRLCSRCHGEAWDEIAAACAAAYPRGAACD